jgi:putative heme-binding domain-containing protein
MRLVSLSISMLVSCQLPSHAGETSPLRIDEGQRIALVGNSLAERMNLYGHFETRIHIRHKERAAVVRNFGRPADEVANRQRPNNYTAIDDPLEVFAPNLFFCFFGFNESFAGTDAERLGKFQTDYRTYIEELKQRFFNSGQPPRFVLVSPIAFESTGHRLQPSGVEENHQLAAYTEAIRELASREGLRFVDLFTLSRALFDRQPAAQFTINGIHLNEAGDAKIAEWLDEALFGTTHLEMSGEFFDRVRAAVNDKSWHHLQDYRMLNGWYVYGGRRTWDTKTFPAEYQKIRNMVAVRDRYVWDLANNRPVPKRPDDSQTGEVLVPKTMFGTRDDAFRKNREPEKLVFPAPEESIAQMQVPEGLKVELFADESEYPELANPCQLDFDSRGRLWVSCMANYPQWRPDLDKPDDRLLIFEDTDQDGKADKCITFYDQLTCPTGFEFFDGGVLVIDQPRILFLKDTDGDDRADVVIHVMDGIASDDTHHTMGAWEVSHDGLIYMLEGISTSTTLETPYGPFRNKGPSGAYVWDPQSWRIRYFRTPGYGNPWCMVFDEWGNGIVGDGTGAQQHWTSPLSGAAVTTRKTMRPIFDNEGMRPAVGSEFLRSRHLPDKIHDHFVYGCVINMHGLPRFTIRDESSGAGFVGERIDDLLDSTDDMFRPVDPHVGPDGAIWFGDWCNPLIGHMQYSQRDPNRDHDHGRIYRLVNDNRPLLQPETQYGKSIAELLQQLNSYELRTRCRSRRELRDRNPVKVLGALEKWLKTHDDPRLLCEALWVQASLRRIDSQLLKRVLTSDDFRARAAAVNVLGNHWRHISDAQELLAAAVHDEHARVRVEAIRGLSFLDNAKAAEQALLAVQYEMDYWVRYTLEQTLNALRPAYQPLLEKKQFLTDAPDRVRQYFERFLIEQLPGGAAVRPLAVATNEEADASARDHAIAALSRINAGNADRGKVVYDRVCASCHIIGETGKNFGPDLDDVGARLNRRQIIKSIVDPNAEISEGYKTVTVADADGAVANGFIVNETKELLTLRVEGGFLKHFVVADLEERSERNASSMPDGLTKTIAPIEFLDVVAFLHRQRKTSDGWFPSNSPDAVPREDAGLRELSHDADIKLGKDFPEQYNQDADLFLGGDGNTRFDFTIHSPEPASNPHVLVRLARPSKIHRIWVQNRVNKQFHDRAKSLALWLSNDGKSWQRIWQAESPAAEWQIDLPQPLDARFLKIGLQETGILNLRQMVVYGE